MSHISISILGANGKMGSNLINRLGQFPDIMLKYAITSSSTFSEIYYLKNNTNNIKKALEDSDIIIDFTSPQYTLEVLNLNTIVKNPAKFVIGTTGFSNSELKEIDKYSKKFAIFLSSNFSIGMNYIFFLLKKLSKTDILNEFDIRIKESHHKFKKDIPSGTALELRKAFSKSTIEIDSYREGDIKGYHSINFTSDNESITLSHTAFNRSIFSDGALKASIYLYNKYIGLYKTIY